MPYGFSPTSRSRVLVSCLALAASALLVGAAPGRPGGASRRPGAAQAPTLVVLLTIDQFRADYLDRFAPQLHGGLARLVAGGAYFTEAYHDHAIPETAPGHATLLSGRFPRSTGILANEIGVDDPESPQVDGARGGGSSPRRFRGSTLADWLRDRDRRSRALGLSSKPRSAILPLGRARGEAYWLSGGRFTTSTYYGDSLAGWVRRFNERDLPRRSAGTEWTTLLPDSAYPEPDAEQLEGLGRSTFPHRLPADSALAAALVGQTPRMDEILLALALDGVQARALGAGSQGDLLSVSLSPTDAIGHLYGPDSREMHDQVLRLDRSIGVFLDSLYRLRDSTRVIVVLTSDHGVAPLPELSARRGEIPMPTRVDMAGLFYPARATLRAAGADTNAVGGFLGLVVMDRPAVTKAGIDPDSLRDAIARYARENAGILRADRPRDMAAADQQKDVIARRWTHQLPAGTSVELVITLAPYNIWWSDNVASHQTPHAYDTHVPLIFYGAPFRGGRYPEFVRTVDIAPTLAAVLGLRPSEALDGVALRRALR